MKTPEEWFEEELSGEPLTQESVIEVIKMIQQETIEETVKLCAEKAESITDIDKYIYGSIVDKDSILNCVDILKKEL